MSEKDNKIWNNTNETYLSVIMDDVETGYNSINIPPGTAICANTYPKTAAAFEKWLEGRKRVPEPKHNSIFTDEMMKSIEYIKIVRDKTKRCTIELLTNEKALLEVISVLIPLVEALKGKDL